MWAPAQWVGYGVLALPAGFLLKHGRTVSIEFLYRTRIGIRVVKSVMLPIELIKQIHTGDVVYCPW